MPRLILGAWIPTVGKVGGPDTSAAWTMYSAISVVISAVQLSYRLSSLLVVGSRETNLTLNYLVLSRIMTTLPRDLQLCCNLHFTVAIPTDLPFTIPLT